MGPFVSNVRARGGAHGMDFTLKCQRTPNTLRAHTLLGWAGEMSASKQNEVMDIVSRQYHTGRTCWKHGVLGACSSVA